MADGGISSVIIASLASEDPELASDTKELGCRPYEKHRPYGVKKARTIQTIYIIAAIAWVFIVVFLGLHRNGPLGYFILTIPLIVFFIGFCFAEKVNGEVEDDFFRINYLSVGLIIMLPLMAYLAKELPGNRAQFMIIILVAFVLSLLSLVDVWVSRKWLSFIKQFKSVCQTMALTLFIYILYLFYRVYRKKNFRQKN